MHRYIKRILDAGYHESLFPAYGRAVLMRGYDPELDALLDKVIEAIEAVREHLYNKLGCDVQR
jgi:hypothetical protein